MSIRNIKFRGKDNDNNWVHGDLIHGVGSKKDNLYILPLVHNLAHIPNCHHLDGVKIENETVGQFTGLRDKNGVDIYENDIVKFHEFKNLAWDEESFKQFSLEERKGELLDHYISKVYWEDSNFLFDASESCQCCLSVCFGNQIRQNPIMVFEVIGNIYDNPELLPK